MKTRPLSPSARRGFTLVEMMITMTIGVMAIGMALSTFMFGLKTMYKDTQRLASNANLRSFTAQITKETLDASYFYLFDYYTRLDGSVNLTTDYAALVIDDNTGTDYDKWASHGDCLVLVTNVVVSGVTKIRTVRIYYRLTTSQATMNANAALRYYEVDYGASGHPSNYTLTQILNTINLNSTPAISGSKQITDRCRGRLKPDATNRYPIFSTETPEESPSTGFVSINVEFITGTSAINMLSSSSFNYTISPRR